MNEPIQITIKLTADKPLLKLIEAFVGRGEAKIIHVNADKPRATKEPPEAAEDPESDAALEAAYEGLGDQNPPEPAPATVEDCIKAAKDAKARGVSTDAIRTTVASFGASRPHDVPEDKLGALLEALRSLR